jgi:NTP pyrophosphatase (non-canonical NTP hydrolase)
MKKIKNSKNMQKIWVLKVSNHNSIQSFQELMKKIYFHRDQDRGVDSTFLWLVEEIGELSKSLRNSDNKNIREEFADVLAWLCSLANLMNIDLIEVAYEKYPEKCPRCLKSVCQCSN